MALGDQAAVAFADAQARLLNELPRSLESAMCMTEMRTGFAGLSASTIERARDALMAQGLVLRRGGGVKGDPYRYWSPERSPDDGFGSSHLAEEFGQNESDLEDDYPRSAWDPDASARDPEPATTTAAGEGGGTP